MPVVRTLQFPDELLLGGGAPLVVLPGDPDLLAALPPPVAAVAQPQEEQQEEQEGEEGDEVLPPGALAPAEEHHPHGRDWGSEIGESPESLVLVDALTSRVVGIEGSVIPDCRL